MSTQTTNYKLTKADENEYYNVGVVNTNLDIIDSELNKTSNKIGDLAKSTNTNKTSVIDITNEINASLSECAKKKDLDTANANLAQLSNPNLLINGDFQVWQRGESFDKNGYSADRWKLFIGSGGTVNRNSNGSLNMKKTVSDNQVVNIQQIIESITVNKLRGKTLTFSVNCDISADLQIVAKTDTSDWVIKNIPKNINVETYSLTFTVPLNATSLLVMLQLGNDSKIGEINVNWTKLEIGDKKTPFVPRLYAEELALCQRYCLKCDLSGVAVLQNVVSGTNTFPTEMRVIPSIKSSPSSCVFKHGIGMQFNLSQAPKAIYGFTVNDFGYLQLSIEDTPRFEINSTYKIYNIILDSEIY